MIILIKLFLNSQLDLIRTTKFVKQLFIIQIQKGGKALLWNQVKSRMEACHSEFILSKYIHYAANLSMYLHANHLRLNKQYTSVEWFYKKWCDFSVLV